jgi:sortase (surface protein transpeptidase)
MIAGTPRGRSGRGRACAPAVVLALAVCLSACSTPSGSGGSEGVTASPTATAAPTAAPAPTAVKDVPVTSSALTAPEAAVAPVSLQIADIGVDMPVVPVGVDPDAQMELPVDPATAGWYRFGADAASASGNIVLSAHVDAPQYPIGPLAALRDLDPGDEVVVTDETGEQRTYAIDTLTYYRKTELPVDDIFARDGDSRLVIVTCGGPFDPATGRYRDNVVAVALPQ